MRPCKRNVFLMAGFLITALFTLSSNSSAFTLASMFRAQLHLWYVATNGASLIPKVDNYNARDLTVSRFRIEYFQPMGSSLRPIKITENVIRFKETQPNLRNPEKPLNFDVELRLGAQTIPIVKWGASPRAISLSYTNPGIFNKMPVVLTRTGPDQMKQSVRAFVKYEFYLPLESSSSHAPIFNLILTIPAQATYPSPMEYTISLAPRYIQRK